MKNYVIVSHDTGSNKAYYYQGIINGSYWFGNINDAIRFDYNELCDYIASHIGLCFLGFSVVRIEDCTFDRIKTDKELQEKYTDFLYVAR